MIDIRTDPHTHTVASIHAFGTIEENARHAAEKGLEAIAMTDHYGPPFTIMAENGVPHFSAMQNMQALPKEIAGVRILAGVEIDIIDVQGHLFGYDIELPYRQNGGTILSAMLDTREITIASVHFFPGCRSATAAQGTEMYCRVLETPGTHVIGHPGRAGVPFDIPEVLQTAKAQNKMIEINNHSMDFGQPVTELCRDIAWQCAAMGVRIIVSSDAHSSFFVGEFSKTIAMLEEIEFPQHLIVNRSLDTLMRALEEVGQK